MIAVQQRGERLRFAVRVVARSSRTAVGGVRDGALIVRVTAAPVDGAANEAVVAALAAALGVPARELRIEAGATARRKVVSAPARAAALLGVAARSL